MTKQKSVVKESSEIQELKQRIKDIRNTERSAERITKAKQTLEELEPEYSRAKEVFFKVNGAKRILKNAD